MGPLLLVEDNAEDVLFIRRAFKKIGWDPDLRVESDGHCALQYLRHEGSYADRGRFPDPSRLILDLKLPRVSGLDILSWVRSSPSLGDMPTMILTSSQQPEDIARAYALRCDAYLVKPVSFANLVRVAGALREWATRSTPPRIPEVVIPLHQDLP